MTENEDTTRHDMADEQSDAEDATPTGGSSSRDIRATKRARREAERAARAQRKAEAARERAVEAARAGGLFEGMESASPDRPAGSATVRTGTAGSAERGTRASGDDTGTSAWDDTDVAASVAGTPPARRPMDPKRRRRLMSLLSVASVLLLVVAGLATWRYIEAREDTAAAQAVSNAPQAATDAAREIATEMFTYDHRTVDEDLAAVRDRLTDPALSEFVEQSMPTVATSAKEHDASVYATVAAAAAEEVTDAEHVTVLVMLNRMVSTKESPEAQASASRLRLHMVEIDGTWKLGELVSL